MSGALVRYDSMVRAIAECREVDELKDYRDKARALELYAKQARNREAEAQAADVRIRAERQCSILIREGQAAGTIATQSSHGKGIQTSVAPFDTRTLSDLNITRDQSSRWGKLADIPDDEFEALLSERRTNGDIPTTDGIASRVGILTGDFEWYTPAEYVDAARRVLGSIDLDPASSEFAQQIVGAARFFSEADDGLSQEWGGRVFLNPPYKHPLCEHFVKKLVASYAAGLVTDAVLLTNNATDTEWWHTAAVAAKAICFTRGRISFYQRDGAKNSPTHGQTFFYFGDDTDVFAGEFSNFGLVR